MSESYSPPTTSFVLNNYGQPVGEAMPDWTTRPEPESIVMQGKYCRLEPLSNERHSSDLHAAFSASPEDCTYSFIGPFETLEDYQAYVSEAEKSTDPKHYAIINMATGKAEGSFSFLRIQPVHGVIEVGYVRYSQALKNTTAATEAQYLLMKYAFEGLGYRRYEWKCDSLNFPSRKAAERLGFTFESIFRQAIVYRGRSRDTAWFSILDKEWPQVKAALESWLSPDNFDSHGRQVKSLVELRNISLKAQKK